MHKHPNGRLTSLSRKLRLRRRIDGGETPDLLHQCCTLRRIARAYDATLSSAGWVIKTLFLGRHRNQDARVSVQWYQWDKPGDMIHVDTKQLDRFERVGHRITCDRRQGCFRAVG